MTKNTFVALCVERTIDPAIALEDEDVRLALFTGDDDAVVAVLDAI